jgi:hypothetical protein
MVSLSGSSVTATEPAVLPSSTAESAPSTPAGDEKHNPTSPVEDEKRPSTSRRPSLKHHASSPIPTEAAVLGATGFVLEDEEKADAATAFKHHQSPAPTTTYENGTGHEEKQRHVVAENGVPTTGTGTGTGTTTETELTQGESEEEADDEVVFPGNTQLALLTFGLCVATFTVALGE